MDGRDSRCFLSEVATILDDDTDFPIQDQKLRTALQDYENEKWRIVANKVGTGFTPAACRERAAQLSGDISEMAEMGEMGESL